MLKLAKKKSIISCLHLIFLLDMGDSHRGRHKVGDVLNNLASPSEISFIDIGDRGRHKVGGDVLREERRMYFSVRDSPRSRSHVVPSAPTS